MHPGLCSPPEPLNLGSGASRRGELQLPAAPWTLGRRGARVTWVLSLGGLFLSAAAAAWGTGAFCSERLRGGPRSGEAGGLPQRARSRSPLARVGGRLLGRASP